jgi:hypothetical protein
MEARSFTLAHMVCAADRARLAPALRHIKEFSLSQVQTFRLAVELDEIQEFGPLFP